MEPQQTAISKPRRLSELTVINRQPSEALTSASDATARLLGSATACMTQD